MYDRAPRVLIATAASNSTPEGVGPGTYAFLGSDSSKNNIGYAPFLSLSKRESFLTVKEQAAVIPGPGQYMTHATSDHIKGCSTLKNKSCRFLAPPSITPGPGKYTLASTISKKSDTRSRSLPSSRKNKRPRLTYVRQNTAPSIPYPGQNFGYEENECGQLKPQDIPPHDHTLGPAYYNISTVDTVTTKKYKGTHFGCLKSKRTQFEGRKGPGPTDYDPSSHHTSAPTVPSNSAKLLRYHELIPYQEAKKGTPGPGKYNLATQFSKDSPESTFVGFVIEPPPFGSSQERFLSDPGCSPASTKYDDPRTAMESLKKVRGMTNSPFGQTSIRFKPDRNAQEIPGPGSYNDNRVTTLSYQLNQNPSLDIGGAFGTSSVRTVPFVTKDSMHQPGPAEYFHSDNVPATRTNKKHSSMFASTIKRLYSPPEISIPPPGSYDVSESYDKSQGRANVKPTTPNSAFLSSDARFAPPRDILLNETDFLNPGPGNYDYEEWSKIGTNPHGLISSRDQRFKPMAKQMLGPGSYQLSKRLCDTVLKGTFNASLCNPLKDDCDTSLSGKQAKISLRTQTITL